MAIKAADVGKLRKMTGAGMMDCKKALVEAEGDFDKAIEILRMKGQKLSEKRADRETKEGSVFVRVSEDGSTAHLIAFTCETDFVAKNDDFQALGNEIADAAKSNSPADLAALNALSLGDVTVEEKITGLVGKIGEKLAVTTYETISGEKVASYIHSNGKLGVLVAMTGAGDAEVVDAGKDVGMQIAAMNPVALDKDGVDPTTIEKEIANIKLDLQIERFDQIFGSSKPSDLPELKQNYPFLFSEKFADSVWFSRMDDPIQHLLNSAVDSVFKDFSSTEAEITSFYQHFKYHNKACRLKSTL